MQISTVDWARGRWRWLAREWGIDDSFLTGGHGPCPKCGGKDRFRFDDKEQTGSWFCTNCGSGDGFDLLGLITGHTFKQIAKEMDSKRGLAPGTEDKFKSHISDDRKRQNLNQVWRSACDFSVTRVYLNSRGLTDLDNLHHIRGAQDLPLFERDKPVVRLPAMVALISNKDGDPVSIHRTYLGDNRDRVKKIMPTLSTISGGAIRLHPITNKGLIVAEGIESAIAGRTVSGSPQGSGLYAAISATGMRSMALPEDLEILCICADNDVSFTGQAAAFELARRAVAAGIKTCVLVPDIPGHDMVDVLFGAHPFTEHFG